MADTQYLLVYAVRAIDFFTNRTFWRTVPNFTFGCTVNFTFTVNPFVAAEFTVSFCQVHAFSSPVFTAILYGTATNNNK
jgi:hypothetical protein